jgi:hypothetical protein
MEDYLANMGRGAANQTKLSKDVVVELPYLSPCQSISNQFESLAKDKADQIENFIQQNIHLAKARDLLLLPSLMNGEVIV